MPSKHFLFVAFPACWSCHSFHHYASGFNGLIAAGSWLTSDMAAGYGLLKGGSSSGFLAKIRPERLTVLGIL